MQLDDKACYAQQAHSVSGRRPRVISVSFRKQLMPTSSCLSAHSPTCSPLTAQQEEYLPNSSHFAAHRGLISSGHSTMEGMNKMWWAWTPKHQAECRSRPSHLIAHSKLTT